MPKRNWLVFSHKGERRSPKNLSLAIRATGAGALTKACSDALGNPREVSFLVQRDHTAFAIVAPPRPGASVYKLSGSGALSVRRLARMLGIRLPVTLSAKLEDGMLVFELPPADSKEAPDAAQV